MTLECAVELEILAAIDSKWWTVSHKKQIWVIYSSVLASAGRATVVIRSAVKLWYNVSCLISLSDSTSFFFFFPCCATVTVVIHEPFSVFITPPSSTSFATVQEIKALSERSALHLFSMRFHLNHKLVLTVKWGRLLCYTEHMNQMLLYSTRKVERLTQLNDFATYSSMSLLKFPQFSLLQVWCVIHHLQRAETTPETWSQNFVGNWTKTKCVVIPSLVLIQLFNQSFPLHTYKLTFYTNKYVSTIVLLQYIQYLVFAQTWMWCSAAHQKYQVNYYSQYTWLHLPEEHCHLVNGFIKN